MRRPSRRAAGLLLAVTLLAGCGVSEAKSPDWRPKPSFNAEGGPNAQLPTPGAPPSAGAPAPNEPNSPSSPSGSPSGPDPAVVATRLAAPTGIALLPDGSALVGERRTGRIVRVRPQPGQPVPTVRTLPGVDGSGDGGLLDLALSPTYAEDNLVYAYVTTRTDNRVVDFTLAGPVTPVVTGIPKGARGNTGRLVFAPDGNLLVGTGDADTPALAATPTSLAGKILRVDAIGRPAAGNPVAASVIYSRGHHTVDGLCVDPVTGAVFDTERGSPGVLDEVNVVTAGADDGWPTAGAASRAPVLTLPADRGAVGGCAVQGRGLYLTSRDGRSVLAAPLTGTHSGVPPLVGDATELLKGRYGRLLTVVAAPDGALWITTSNRDGHGVPVAADERVLRVAPAAAGSGNPPV